MKKIGTLANFQELSAIAKAIFSRAPQVTLPNGSQIKTRSFKEGKLYAVDHAGIRYVEQNPNTSSIYAERVREEGAKIIWVIRNHRRTIDGAGKVYFVPCSDQWLGRIDNDQVFMDEAFLGRKRKVTS